MTLRKACGTISLKGLLCDAMENNNLNQNTSSKFFEFESLHGDKTIF